MSSVKFPPSLERPAWYGPDTAGGSGGPGFVNWVRSTFMRGSLVLLVWAGLALPASAQQTLFTSQTPALTNLCDSFPSRPMSWA